jgi:metacaspase-1
MCVNWFKKKPDPVIGNNIALLYGINNWPGSDNDLNGCLNDGQNVAKFLALNYSEYSINRFRDSDVTRAFFRNMTKNTFVAAKPGDKILLHYSGHGTYGLDPYHTEADGYSEALYLYDGPFWDREFADLIALLPLGVHLTIALDSCFAKGATTRLFKSKYLKSKFMPIQSLRSDVPRRKSMMKSEDLNYVLYSGCQERQTSADAFIDGSYVGAFTYFWLKGWKREFNNDQWGNETIYRIHNAGFEQVPAVMASQTLMNQRVLT